jgi:RNA polymerase sigma-70 factor (ECF subfamily)
VSTKTRGYSSTREPENTDSLLVDLACCGDQDAFEALVNRYQRSLFGLIYRYVGEYHEAQDVLQQVWLQLFLSLPTLSPDMRVKPWLFTVAHNLCVDVMRRRRRQLLSFSEVETGSEEDEAAFLNAIIDMSPTQDELLEQRELERAILRAIQAVPRTYRSVVLLYYQEHMNYAEIGRVLNVPVSTVKARFHRAKPFMRAVLTAQEVSSQQEPG